MSIISALGEITLEVGVKKGRQEREAEILALIDALIKAYSESNHFSVYRKCCQETVVGTLDQLKTRIQEAK